MISSRSGHASGIFLPNWSPLVPSDLTKNSKGLLYLMGNLVDSGTVTRIFISTGKAIDDRERVAIGFNGEQVRDMYLPEWFLLDLTISGNTKENTASAPRTLTFVSVPTKIKELDISIESKIFVGRNSIVQSSWKEFSLIAGRFRMDELWHRITGIVRPSWGTYSPADETFFVADANSHFGVVSDEKFPLGFDMTDIGRIENFLRECGIDVEEIERPIEEVAKTLNSFEGGSSVWTKAVKKMIEEEKEKSSISFLGS